MKYRKKPVVIEAVRWEGDLTVFQPWREQYGFSPAFLSSKTRCVGITTLEGTMSANLGDWVIRGIAGEFYPCNPDVFEATYEKVDGS